MNHVRHSNLFDVSRFTVTLIGLGGIGSPTALALAKMGFGALDLWDPDEVSPENIATQLHSPRDIGESKLSSMYRTLTHFSDDHDQTNLGLYPYRVGQEGTQLSGIVVSAVDSIAARKEIWVNSVKPSARYYIDARMAAESLQIFFVDLEDQASVERYEENLAKLDDENVPDVPCTEKATIYCGFGAAAFICAALRKLLTGQPVPRRVIYDFISNFRVVEE